MLLFSFYLLLFSLVTNFPIVCLSISTYACFQRRGKEGVAEAERERKMWKHSRKGPTDLSIRLGLGAASMFHSPVLPYATGLVLSVIWWLKWVVIFGVYTRFSSHDLVGALDKAKHALLRAPLTLVLAEFLFKSVSESVCIQISSGMWPKLRAEGLLTCLKAQAAPRMDRCCVVCVLTCQCTSFINIYTVPYVQTVFSGFA